MLNRYCATCQVNRNSFRSPGYAGLLNFFLAAFLRFLLPRHKPDRSFRLGFRWPHQFAHGTDETGDGLIMRIELALQARFQFAQLECQFFIADQQFAQRHERAHHIDRHLDGAWAVQDRRRHDRPMLGEGVGHRG